VLEYSIHLLYLRLSLSSPSPTDLENIFREDGTEAVVTPPERTEEERSD
jgi:hypothetical protein